MRESILFLIIKIMTIQNPWPPSSYILYRLSMHIVVPPGCMLNYCLVQTEPNECTWRKCDVSDKHVLKFVIRNFKKKILIHLGYLNAASIVSIDYMNWQTSVYLCWGAVNVTIHIKNISLIINGKICLCFYSETTIEAVDILLTLCPSPFAEKATIFYESSHIFAC